MTRNKLQTACLHLTYFLVCLVPLFYDESLYQMFSLSKAALFNIGTAVLFFLFICSRTPIKKSELLFWLLVYSLLLFLSMSFSIHLWASYFGVFNRHIGISTWLSMMAVFVIINTLSIEEDIKQLVMMFSISSFIGAVWGIYHGYGDVLRLPITGNTNTYGNFMLMGFPLAVYTAYEYRKNAAAWLLPLVVLGGVYYSKSRGVWVSLGALTVIYAAYKTKRIKTFIASGLIIFTGIVAYSYISGSQNRFISAFRYNENPRYLIALESLKVIKESPFLGSGPSTFRISSTKYRSKKHGEMYGHYYDSAHNIYLNIAATTGLPSLGIYIVLLFVFFRSKRNNNLSDAISFSMLGFCLVGFFTFDSFSTGPIWISLIASADCLKQS